MHNKYPKVEEEVKIATTQNVFYPHFKVGRTKDLFCLFFTSCVLNSVKEISVAWKHYHANGENKNENLDGH